MLNSFTAQFHTIDVIGVDRFDEKSLYESSENGLSQVLETFMIVNTYMTEMPNIAIIDNEPQLAKLYEDAIAFRGHKVVFIAGSCAEAYEKLKTMDQTPDMIVVSFDHESDALKMIKSEYPSIIVKEVRARGPK